MKISIIVFLLSFSLITHQEFEEAHEASLKSSLDVVNIGKHCIQVARSVIEAATQSDAEEALKHLKLLQADKEHLEQHAKSTISALESTQSETQKELDRTRSEVAKLAQAEQSLKQEKARLEVTLEQRQRTLRENEGKVAEENKALEHARDRLRKAKKSAQDKRRTGAIVGGLLGLVTGGIGAGIVGGIAGTAGAEIINQIEGDIDRAEDRLRDREHAVNEAKRAVSETQNRINGMSKKFNELQKQIEEKKQEGAKIHNEAGKIRKAIVFQQRVAELWSMFLLYAENAGDRTSYLEEIVTTATKTQDWNILGTDGTQLFQASFLEAWEEVERAAKKTGSYYHMFIDE